MPNQPLPFLREGGYKLLRFECGSGLQEEGLGASLQSVTAPALLRRTLSLSPRNTAIRCPMFVKIMRRGQAYKLGFRVGDMLVELSENRKAWQMGSIDSLQRKLLSPGSFEIFVLRKDYEYVRPRVTPSDATEEPPRKRNADCEDTHPPKKLFVSTKNHPDVPSPHTPTREVSKYNSKENQMLQTPELKSTYDSSPPVGPRVGPDIEGKQPEDNVQGPSVTNGKEEQLDASKPSLGDLVRPTIAPMDSTYFLQLLDNNEDLQSFLEKDGLHTVFRLLEVSAVEKVHTFCWELIETSQRCFDCMERLSEVPKFLVLSLALCESEKLFQVLLCIMLSPAMDSLESLHEFVLMDGAIPSFLKAMEQAKHCKDSVIESMRLLNQMILHPDALQILKEANGLSSIARIMDEYKASATVQQMGREVVLNLLA